MQGANQYSREEQRVLRKSRGGWREIKQLSFGVSGTLPRTAVLKHTCAQDRLESLLKHKPQALAPWV